MAEKDLKALFIHQLKDTYFAENAILKALPQMAEAAQSEELRGALAIHLRETEDPMGAIGSTPLSGRVRVLNHPLGSDHASPLSSISRTRRYPHRSQRDLRVPGTQPFNLGHHLPGSGWRREDVQTCGAQR